MSLDDLRRDVVALIDTRVPADLAKQVLAKFEEVIRADEVCRIIANDSAGKEPEPIAGPPPRDPDHDFGEPYRLEKINRRIRP